MPITLQYQPDLSAVAGAAAAGGQYEEAVRQQGLDLAYQQLAQRDRMQLRDLDYRQFALGQQLRNANLQQARSIANQQQLAQFNQLGRERLAGFQQYGRERLAGFDAAHRNQQMAYQAAQQEESQRRQFMYQEGIEELRQKGRSDLLNLQLNAEGKQYQQQMQRRRQAVQEWATTNGYGPDSQEYQQAMNKIRSLEAGIDLSNFTEEIPNIQSFIENQVTPFGGGFAWFDREGNFQYQSVPKEHPDREPVTFDLGPDMEPLEIPYGQGRMLPDGSLIYHGDRGPEVIREPQQERQISPIERNKEIANLAKDLMRIKVTKGEGLNTYEAPLYNSYQEAWREAEQKLFGSAPQGQGGDSAYMGMGGQFITKEDIDQWGYTGTVKQRLLDQGLVFSSPEQAAAAPIPPGAVYLIVENGKLVEYENGDPVLGYK